MAEPLKPFSRWNTGTTQNAIPANDNILRTEALEFPALSVLSAQPGSPADGDIHILGAAPSGAQWASFAENDVVIFDSGTWYAFEPFEGWLKKDLGSGDMLEFDGTEWAAFSGGGGGSPNLDGGVADSNFGGTTAIDGGTA